MKEWFAQYWAGVACGALVTIIVTLWKRLVAMRNGMKALLWFNIIQAYNECRRNGWCPIYMLEATSEMLKQYKLFNGNHGIERYFEEMKSMPSEPKKTRQKTTTKE